jgi:hypothetical protein
MVVRQGTTHDKFAKTSFKGDDWRDGHRGWSIRERRSIITRTNSTCKLNKSAVVLLQIVKTTNLGYLGSGVKFQRSSGRPLLPKQHENAKPAPFNPN